MKLNKYQVEHIFHMRNTITKPTPKKINYEVYLYSQKLIKNIITFLVNSSYMSSGDIGTLIEDYIKIANDFNIKLAGRGMDDNEINRQYYYYQHYIHNKLMHISDYFTEIQYFEGCEYIKHFIDVTNNIITETPESEDFFDQLDKLLEL